LAHKVVVSGRDGHRGPELLVKLGGAPEVEGAGAVVDGKRQKHRADIVAGKPFVGDITQAVAESDLACFDKDCWAWIGDVGKQSRDLWMKVRSARQDRAPQERRQMQARGD
jgi:hypothetical protein